MWRAHTKKIVYAALFAALEALPRDALPVTRWTDQDDAWADIAQGIRKLVTDAA